MSLRDTFEAAALKLFNTFEDFIIDATYVQGSSAYVPGGNNVVTSVEYSVRVIRDDIRSTLTLKSVGSVADDVTFNAMKYLMITSELAVTPMVKDKLIIDGVSKTIVAIESDPGDIVTILFVG